MSARGTLSIDALHVINLDRRPERMRRFVNRVRNEQEWDVPIMRHSAVDTSTWAKNPGGNPLQASLATYVDETQLAVIARGYRHAEHELSVGAVGCTLSHMALWMYLAAQTNTEYLAIFEDDAVWSYPTHPGLAEVLDLLHSRIPNTWDVLSLGSQHTKVARAHDFYSELNGYWGTHAYIIHRDSVPRLLANMLPIRKQLDAALSEKTERAGLQVLAVNRVMYWQQSSETDIQVPWHLADGSVRNVDGTYTDPDGTRRSPDGTVIESP